LWSVTLGQNLLEYKTAKVKKESRINKWWSAGAVFFSIGAILLIIWGVFSRRYPYGNGFRDLALGVMIVGATLLANAWIERERFQKKRIRMREMVRTGVSRAGLLCFIAFAIYLVIQIFTN